MVNGGIDLHIFTNATRYAPGTEIIEATHRSFLDTFGAVDNTYVWYDPKPNTNSAQEYLRHLNRLFVNVEKTDSLVDGYIKAILGSNARYLFMLEHDWEFIGERIEHGLEEICGVMERDNLIHLRFNIFSNMPKGGDAGMVEVTGSSIPYCVTPQLSNNPHIIRRQRYIDEALPHISAKRNARSRGIEEKLRFVDHLSGAVYGALGYPATIVHLDGAGRGTGPLVRLRTRLGAAKGGLYKFVHKIRKSARR